MINNGKAARFGFIVPVYKIKKQYLTECIESLRNQTIVDIEIILVDDCSPDDCGKLCDGFAREDSRITVVHHEVNMGLSTARNSGIAKSSAYWLSFVDADDWVELDMCERLTNALSGMPEVPDMLMFSGCRSYPNHEETGVHQDGIHWWRTAQERGELQILALSQPLKSYPSVALAIDSACGKLFRREFLIKNQLCFRPLPYREDGMFFQEAVQKASIVVKVPERSYHYRMTGNSMVNSFRPKAPDENQEYQTMLWAFARENQKGEAYHRALFCAAFMSMQICITQCFFNRGNALPFAERQRGCKAYFGNEPYRNALTHIPFSLLKRNHLLKALCIRFRWYAGVAILRNIYLKANDYQCFE